MLENPQEVLAKIANLCDSLINGQENCVSWIKSEDNVNSQTEELVETLEGSQSELRIYKDLLMEDTGHAPAMKFDSRQYSPRYQSGCQTTIMK